MDWVFGDEENATSAMMDDDSMALSFFLLDVCQSSADSVQLFGRIPAQCIGGKSRSCCVNIDGVYSEVVFIVRDGLHVSAGKAPAVLVAEVNAALSAAGLSNFSVCNTVRKMSGYAVGGQGNQASPFLTLSAEYPALQRASILSSGLFSTGHGMCYSRVVDPYESTLEMVCIKHGILERMWIEARGKSISGTGSSKTTCGVELSMQYRTLQENLKLFPAESLPNDIPRDTIPTVVIATVAMDRSDASVIVEERELAGGIPTDRSVSRRTWSPGVSKVNIASCVVGVICDVDPDIIVCHDVDPRLIIPLSNECGTVAWRLGRMSHLQSGSAKDPPSSWRSLHGRMFLDTATVANESGLDSVRDAKSLETASILLALDPYGDVGPDTMAGEAERTAAIEDALDGIKLAATLSSITGLSLGSSLAYPRHAHVERYLMKAFYENGYLAPSACSHASSTRTTTTTTAPSASNVTGRKTYVGGLVLDALKGLHKDYVVLLDFKSLYPSIIAEFDLCTTTVVVSSGAMPPPPLPTPKRYGKWNGIIPERVWKLVIERRAASNNALRQKALKLVANAIYGCLAYAGSRFHMVELAAAITKRGREALTRMVNISKERCEESGVLMGDTDSVFVRVSGASNASEARSVGNEIAHAVNFGSSYMEASVQSVFDRMLIESKKRYAARECLANGDKKIIVKGLEMVKRDWCRLVWHASMLVINAVFEDRPDQVMPCEISRSLRAFTDQLGSAASMGTQTGVPLTLADFVICKDVRRWWRTGERRGPWDSLIWKKQRKNIKKSQPQNGEDSHAVARAETGGINAIIASKLASDHIWPPPAGGFLGVIIGARESPACVSASEVARTACAVRKSASGNLIPIRTSETLPIPDVEYYVSTQLFPPICRLVEATGICGQSDVALALELTRRPHSGCQQTAAAAAATTTTDATSTTISDRTESVSELDFRVKCGQCQLNFLAIGAVKCSGTEVTCPMCGSPLTEKNVKTSISLLEKSIKEMLANAFVSCSSPTCHDIQKIASDEDWRTLKEGGVLHCSQMNCGGYCTLSWTNHSLALNVLRERKLIESYIPLWDKSIGGIHNKEIPPCSTGGMKRVLCNALRELEDTLLLL